MGADRSEGNATTGLQQVGTVWTQSGSPHAALWSGTSNSFVDLNPSAASASYANGISGSEQVGYAQIGNNNHAALWFDNSDSFVDLHAVLATNYTDSEATGISSIGNITTIAGYGVTTSGSIHAILWTIRRPPTLAITAIQSLGGNNVLTLKWTSSGSGLVLESARNITGLWSNVTPYLSTNGGQVTALLTNPAPQQFFRLRDL